MPRIPFIEAKFARDDYKHDLLVDRFEKYLKQLRRSKTADIAGEDANADDYSLPELFDGSDTVALRRADQTKIARRVSKLVNAHLAATGIDHLSDSDKKRLVGLRDGVEIVAIESEARADEIAADLHADMPWMAPATTVVWHALRRSVREGWTGVRLPPLLLSGPPGIGKSHFARRLAGLVGTSTDDIEATHETAGFGISGLQKGWGTANPGRLLELILKTRIGNPIIVIDEVEKAGVMVAKSGERHTLADALLPLLEPLSAKSWSCPYFRVRFDMSWVGWVMTANDHTRLPAPLLSRCPPVVLRDLTLAEVSQHIRFEGKRRGLSHVAIDATLEAVERHAGRHRIDLRLAGRLLDRAVDLQDGPVLN